MCREANLPLSQISLVAQEPIGNQGSDDTGDGIPCKPDRMSRHMLSGSIPHSRNQRESRADRAFEHTQQRPKGHETPIVIGDGMKSQNNTP